MGIRKVIAWAALGVVAYICAVLTLEVLVYEWRQRR
jgi:hypothetical protein